GPHRHFEDAGIHDIAADADELDAGRSVASGRLHPFDPLREDHRDEEERLDVVDDGRLRPQTAADLAGERRLVARLGALPLDRLEQRALLAADVEARTDENLQIELEI